MEKVVLLNVEVIAGEGAFFSVSTYPGVDVYGRDCRGDGARNYKM